MKKIAAFVVFLVCVLMCVGCVPKPNPIEKTYYTLESIEMVSRLESRSNSYTKGYLFVLIGVNTSLSESSSAIHDYYRFRVRDKEGAVSDVMVPVCNHPCFSIKYKDDAQQTPTAILTIDKATQHVHEEWRDGKCNLRYEQPYHECDQAWELHIPKGSIPQMIDMRLSEGVQK